MKIKFILQHICSILLTSVNRWIIIISLVLIGVFFTWQLTFHNFQIFPLNNNFTCHFYNDSASGGNSQLITGYNCDSVVGIDFKLNNGFFTPYVGINFTNHTDSCVNISAFNQIELDVLGKNMETLGLYLFTFHEINGIKKEVCFYYNIKLKPGRNKYRISLDQFAVPDWWFATNNLLPDKYLKPNLKQFAYFNIGSTYTTELDTIRTLKVYELTFGKNNQKQILLLSLIFIFELILLFFTHYLGLYFGRSKNRQTILYKPIDVTDDNNPANRFIAYINENFNDLGLSLEKVAKETGVHPKFISNSINSNFGLNFKSYINNLRIAESKRLLIGTNLSIGEIAFKVGFNNQSHFNRVFKSIEGKNPSEFKSENN